MSLGVARCKLKDKALIWKFCLQKGLMRETNCRNTSTVLVSSNLASLLSCFNDFTSSTPPTMAFRSTLLIYRPILSSLRANVVSPSSRLSSSASSADRLPINNPNPPSSVPNVSATNILPITSDGAFDASLQESVEDGGQQRAIQAPNRREVWSRSQATREVAMSGPRFEQTIMEMQVSYDVSN